MMRHIPRLVVLELTRRCNLNCIYCRASSNSEGHDDELRPEEFFRVLDELASFSKPIIILSGGEALLRQDVFEIIEYGKSCGLTVVLATCGVTLTKDKAKRLKASGIKRVSISIDGKDDFTHDLIRGQKGIFNKAIQAMELLKAEGIEFQVNTTVSRRNVEQLEDILELAKGHGARSFHPFFLVPVGRAEGLNDEEISAYEYERALNWICKASEHFSIKPTCAPHYARIAKSSRGGCLGGKSFAFISSTGKVQICGFLEVECGDIREESFVDIWETSDVFLKLRNFSKYRGKCGECQYLQTCGGCRARAYAATGNYLEEEPECVYQPLSARS